MSCGHLSLGVRTQNEAFPATAGGSCCPWPSGPFGCCQQPAANAAELNINGVSDYAATASGNSLDQVTSVTQFSDVYPTDWAYQALANLVETYGCVAGYPNGTFRGNRAMTRYEAAALLNACLDRITEVTDELRRLLKEFETELAILKGRVDGLEARVGELEATQFSPPPSSVPKPIGSLVRPKASVMRIWLMVTTPNTVPSPSAMTCVWA